MFSISICSSAALRSLVESVSQVLPELHFVIVNDDNFSGLQLNAIDHHHICCVNAQLFVPPHDVKGSGSFCVATSELITFLQAIDHGCVIQLFGDDDCETVVLRAQDHTSRVYKISCIAREVEDIGLTDMTTVHQVHVQTADFSAFLNLCKKQRYQNINITIHETPSRVKAAPHVDRYFTLSASGDQGSQANHTEVKWGMVKQDTCIDLRENSTAPADYNGDVPENATKIYEEAFSRDFLGRFCKNSPSNDTVFTEIGLCGVEKPLIMHVDLGVERSHVRFVLAAQYE